LKRTISRTTLILILLFVSAQASKLMPTRGALPTQVRSFRFLGIEYEAGYHARLDDAQHLIRELLVYPNWNNSTDQYVSYIRFLSMYNYSEVADDVKAFWCGDLNFSNIKNQIVNFLCEASPGEIVVFFYGGHDFFIDWFLIQMELIDWFNSEALQQAYVTVILDTCGAGCFINFLPDHIVLASSGIETTYCGIFPFGLITGFELADDSNNDGWISAAEVFSYAKNYTEAIVSEGGGYQSPKSHYGKVEGDLPLVPRDMSKPFPTWDVAITRVTANPFNVKPDSSMTIIVSIENQGEKLATCKLYLYANTSLISLEQTTSSSGKTVNVTLTWFPIDAYGLYTLSCSVSICPGELNISNNNLTDGTVYVSIPGDVDGNGKVQIEDIVAIAEAYGSFSSHPKYDAKLDVDCNEFIEVKDLLTAALNYGQHYP